jgi:hypothetical protein
MHAIVRVPRVQDCVSSGRLVTGTQEAAGKRAGTASAKSGQASLNWACAEAAVWLLRTHPAGHKDGARLKKNHGTGKTLTIFAHP